MGATDLSFNVVDKHMAVYKTYKTGVILVANINSFREITYKSNDLTLNELQAIEDYSNFAIPLNGNNPIFWQTNHLDKLIEVAEDKLIQSDFQTFCDEVSTLKEFIKLLNK